MSEKGTCAACDRPDMVLPANGLCGRCYRAKLDGLLYWSDLCQMWLAKNKIKAERLGVVWENDPALCAETEDAPVFGGVDVATGPGETVIQVGNIVMTRHKRKRNALGTPFASVRSRGNKADISLNSVAVCEFGIGECEYVDVYTFATGQVAALVPLDKATDEYSIKLRRQDESARVISATSILRELNVTGSGRYKVEQKDGLVIIDFGEKAA